MALDVQISLASATDHRRFCKCMRIGKLLTWLLVLGFSLDGLFKVHVQNIYLHVSLVIAALWIAYRLLATRFRFIRCGILRLAKDPPLCFYTILMCLHLLLAKDLRVYVFEMLPWLVFIGLYALLATINIDWGPLSRMALWMVILGGAVQYSLARGLGIQIALRDPNYLYGGEFGTRMRGFFLEPNYFGLILFSWLYVNLSTRGRFCRSDIPLTILSVLALILSGNRMVLLAVILLVAFSVGGKFTFNLKRWIPILCVLLFAFAYWYCSIHSGEVIDRSARSRLGTSANILSLWLRSNWQHRILGYGFSNWGLFSNQLGFSVENRQLSWSLTHRDAAEVFVFLFEMGAVSLAIAVYDVIFVSLRATKQSDALFVALIYMTAFFYPVYQFIYYMIPFIIVRVRIADGAPKYLRGSDRGMPQRNRCCDVETPINEENSAT